MQGPLNEQSFKKIGGVIGRKVCPFLISNPSSEPE